MQYLNNFKRIYSLLYFFTLKELKERYKQAYFGFAWMLLVPIVTMATFYFIFTKIFPIEVKNYPIYLLSGLAPWFFFSNGVTQNTTALSGNANLIRKTVFPKHLLILANLNSNFFSYIFSLALISLYLIMSTGFQFRFFLYIPLSLCFFAYSFFFSAPLSYLYIKYRDIKPISDLFIFLLFYAT
ncbi:MAG: ABC transporter permease, partial [Bdellovibrionales bacterium]|nr:ABC transporter permease [Bdellovibrionales bacterium]